jgi:hypothetical protein
MYGSSESPFVVPLNIKIAYHHQGATEYHNPNTKNIFFYQILKIDIGYIYE